MRSQANVSTLHDMQIAATSLTSDLRECALLLDIDGTLLDIAPAPQQVWVPPTLRQTLAQLQELTAGALALVSGRKLSDIDMLFAPLQLAAIGGHGAELRPAPGTEPHICAPTLSAEPFHVRAMCSRRARSSRMLVRCRVSRPWAVTPSSSLSASPMRRLPRSRASTLPFVMRI